MNALVDFWAAALALSLVFYVLLDGFDLGVGMLFALAPNEVARRHMMQSISPVWDGNETWLVVAAAVLFGAFPLVYSVLLSAFYLPLLVMLLALILRGVAFEFRYKSLGLKRLWDVGFSGGSFVAAFVQGAAIGALVQELPTDGIRYTGGAFGWFSPFAILCGFGLCLGYALLGAGWLTLKTEADTRELGYRLMPFLLGGVLLVLITAGAYAAGEQLRVLQRWIEQPFMLVPPSIGLLACLGMVFAMRRRIDWLPLPMTVLIFIAAFVALAASFLPYMVPFSITISRAAAPESSLSFMFWGAGLFVLPLTVIYTVVVYWVFKGKVKLADYD